MLVFYVSVLLLPLAWVSHMNLHSILCSISEARDASLFCNSILLLLMAGVTRMSLRSILHSISEAKSASFVVLQYFYCL